MATEYPTYVTAAEMRIVADQVASLEKRLGEATKLIQELAVELRRRPGLYATLSYPGNRVWTRPVPISGADGTSSIPTLASLESLLSKHDDWIKRKSKNPDIEVFFVAINGPMRTFVMDFEPNESGEQAVTVTVRCVRILLPRLDVTDNQKYGPLIECDAIEGWTATVFDSILNKQVTREVRLLGEPMITPIHDEYYLTQVLHGVVPTSSAFIQE